MTASPVAVWTVNLYSCTSTSKGNWLTPNDLVETVEYDKNIPPPSDVLGSFEYTGPSITICGAPEIELEDDQGNPLSFLSADLVDGSFILSIDNDAAVAGSYNVVAAFQQPGPNK